MISVSIVFGCILCHSRAKTHVHNGRIHQEAVNYLLNNSIITDKESVINLAKEGADVILNSDDPFIYFIVHTKDELKEMHGL